MVAVEDNYELPFWLGPFTMHKRWWGAMFPDVEIDAAAHIVYGLRRMACALFPFPPPAGLPDQVLDDRGGRRYSLHQQRRSALWNLDGAGHRQR
jgi:hypothetical protein